MTQHFQRGSEGLGTTDKGRWAEAGGRQEVMKCITSGFTCFTLLHIRECRIALTSAGKLCRERKVCEAGKMYEAGRMCEVGGRKDV